MKKHNPAYNYFNAVGSKDRGYAKDLVINDVSDIIITKRPMVIAGIRHANIPIDPNADNGKIVSVLVANMGANKQLATNMAKLISYQHTTGNSKQNFAGEAYNTDGPTPFLPTPDGTASGLGPQTPASNTAPAGGGKVGAIASALSAAFGFGTALINNKQQNNAAALQTQQSLLQAIAAKTGTKVNTTKTVLIVGSVLVGLTIAGLIAYKVLNRTK